jgi:hypothetical protein
MGTRIEYEDWTKTNHSPEILWGEMDADSYWRMPGLKEPLTGRARVPDRREGVLEANGVFLVLDQGRLWASGTADREDAIPPSDRSGGCPAASRLNCFQCFAPLLGSAL